MSKDTSEQLIELWMRDMEFHERFSSDPAGAAEAAGLKVDADVAAALCGLNRGVTDTSLQARVSRSPIPLETGCNF